jgi:hypothetical protein
MAEHTEVREIRLLIQGHTASQDGLKGTVLRRADLLTCVFPKGQQSPSAESEHSIHTLVPHVLLKH